MKNTKGLSTVVTTLILVLLVLAAIGIIWNPVKDLLTSSGESLDQTKCLTMEVHATGVDATGTLTVVGCDDGDLIQYCNATHADYCGLEDCRDDTSTQYNVTLSRKVTGEDEIGAKVILFDENGVASGNIDFGTGAPLTAANPIITETINTVDLENANKIRVYPFYIDESTGEEKLCDTYTEWSWVN